jgi:hypothetical protein
MPAPDGFLLGSRNSTRRKMLPCARVEDGHPHFLGREGDCESDPSSGTVDFTEELCIREGSHFA